MTSASFSIYEGPFKTVKTLARGTQGEGRRHWQPHDYRTILELAWCSRRSGLRCDGLGKSWGRLPSID
jgi:hypothetical protein